MITPNNWKDYELIDTGDGMKLERWGKYLLARPDPQAIWPKQAPDLWKKAAGAYTRSTEGGGSWRFSEKLPDRWQVSYPVQEGSTLSIQRVEPSKLYFWVRPTDFKHTGLFPEQSINWDWLSGIIHESCLVNHTSPNVLNLFAYTGASTVACASAGARVTHVDASKGIVTWARENLELNQASPLTPLRRRGEDNSARFDSPSPSERGAGGEARVRWIVDDVFKFVEREVKRGVKYDGIIMDPPSYGRGTKGETWKIEKMLWPLVQECTKVLSDKPLFFLINSYTAGLPATVIGNVLESALQEFGNPVSKNGIRKPGFHVESFELGLKGSATGRILPAGVCARWSC